MNKEDLAKVRRAMQDLEDKHVLLLQLDIVYELDCQLEDELSDEDYCKLYNEIEYAYLKVEGVALENIVRCAIDNLDKILKDDEEFNLREECCWY